MVEIIDNKVRRHVRGLDESLEVIRVLEKKNMHGSQVVETKVSAEEENVLEHKFITPIIHSGEFTASMAYDVTEKSLDMACSLVEDGIYALDVLPHNFTFNNGEWILYDFGALGVSPRDIKTEIRGIFNISFSAFELLRVIPRKYLKHYFLNRVKVKDLFKSISFTRASGIMAKYLFVKLLYICKQYKPVYRMLKCFFEQYKKSYKREYYSLQLTQKDKQKFDRLDEIVSGMENIFCVGEEAAKWAMSSRSDSPAFIYVDDYELCDRIYNYIYKEGIRKLSTGVIYPFAGDEKIPETLSYRAIYDRFAKERFAADCVVFLDFPAEGAHPDDFILNLSGFAHKKLVLKIDKDSSYSAGIREQLDKIYQNVYQEGTFFIAENKFTVEKSEKFEYDNANRRARAAEHSARIVEIAKKFN